VTVTGPLWHVPVPGLQVCPTGQLTGVPPHVPPAHTSAVVHRLPSLQALVLFACAHPLAGTQLSVVQTLPSSQLGAAPPTHAPPAHVSLVVHALPSLQGSVLFVNTHPPVGLQVSVVQTLPSLQASGVPA
jgi:hypothetical protein